MRRHEPREPVAAALRAIHRDQRDGVGAPLGVRVPAAVVVARCTAACQAASSPGPRAAAGRACRRAPRPRHRRAAPAGADACPPASRAERRPCAPCARPSSRAARHQDASASRTADTASRTRRTSGGLLARPDNRRQLADERGPRLGRRRQHARPSRSRASKSAGAWSDPALSAARCIHRSSRCAKSSVRRAAAASGVDSEPSAPSTTKRTRASGSSTMATRRLASDGDERRRGSARRTAFSRTPGVGVLAAPTRSRRRRARRGPRASRARAAARAATRRAPPAPAAARSRRAIAGRRAGAAPCAATRGSGSRARGRGRRRSPTPGAARPDARRARRRGRRGRCGRGPPVVHRRRVLLQIARRPLRVLDARAVVVDDVERAVGPDVEEHRAEPGVAATPGTPSRLGAPRDEGGARRRQHVAVHEVVHRLGDEERRAVASSGKAPPVYTVSAHADVNWPASVSRSKLGRCVIGKTVRSRRGPECAPSRVEQQVAGCAPATRPA